MNGAHPCECAGTESSVRQLRYSISQHEIALDGNCGHTFLSCHTAFWIGVSQLVILSCLNGNAQLPSASGIKASVLYP
ncbi:hypothetical protein, partial [Brunnivagina elsteri]|uniref:hypothetical protein n=1 Tax=Brunnivagina elsteri TaxID=1247191 RepID=UPI001177CB6E